MQGGNEFDPEVRFGLENGLFQEFDGKKLTIS